jgi:hypothetical protein
MKLSAYTRMRIVTAVLASVWIANGLFAKLLGLVPRHQAIVARFFGEAAAPLLTRVIGGAEIVMALWIFSRVQRRSCAMTQAILIVMMNGLELWKARDLLLSPSLMVAGNALLLLLAFWWSRVDTRPAKFSGGN